jgi:uncharacterized membrane protein
MIDDPHTPGAGPQGTGPATGTESSTGGASEWSAVPPPQDPSPVATQPVPPQASAPDLPSQSLEPLPPPPLPPPLSAAPPPPSASGYGPVYGSQPNPGAGGYTSAPGGYPPQPPPPGYSSGPQYPPPGQPPYPPAAGQGLSSNAAAAIAYITFIPAVLFLVLSPYNRDRFVRFHAWQCIALTIVAIGIGIIFAVLNVIGFHLFWWLFLLVRLAIRLILFVFWLIALIKASQGQWYKIPLVGDLANSLAGGQM